MAKDDDDAWRAIVDNYGERPEVDPNPDLPDPADQDATPDDPPVTEAEPLTISYQVPAPSGWDEETIDSDWSTDRFVPPPPPPIPVATTDRLLAWAGLFGSPAILLICLVAGFSLPSLIAYLLVIAFVGGFLYLVIQMSREPRDPGDDGAVL